MTTNEETDERPDTPYEEHDSEECSHAETKRREPFKGVFVITCVDCEEEIMYE